MTDKKTKLIVKKCIYELYSVGDYVKADVKFISTNQIRFKKLKDITNELTNNKNYHFRVHKDEIYNFFGDLDNYNNDINTFKKLLKEFLIKYYELNFNEDEFKYTQNNKKKGLFLIFVFV